MAVCNCLSTCAFFNDKMADMPFLATKIKQTYCMDQFDECARFMVRKALGVEKVPADLFPMQQERARVIIHSFTNGANP